MRDMLRDRTSRPWGLRTALAAALMLGVAPLAAAQSSEDTTQTATEAASEGLDEVIAFGQRIKGQHEGMDAFFAGDFETAEIEFEREFISLKRFESAKLNAANDADLAFDRGLATQAAGDNSGSSITGPGGAVTGSGAQAQGGIGNPSTSFRNRRSDGQTVLTDGKVTFEDFAVARYMSGLSEIKLGKYAEAKTSLRQSLRYDQSNFDARMRLGLLAVQDGDFDAAADQLERIDRQRVSCKKRDCDELADLNQAALELAGHITKAIKAR